MERHSPTAIKRARRIARLVGALVGLLGGIFYGLFIIRESPGTLDVNRTAALIALVVCCAVGLFSGALAGPLLSVEPFLWVEERLETAAPAELVGGLGGLVVALLVAVLVGLLLGGLPAGVGIIVSLPLAGALVYVGVRAGTRRGQDLIALSPHLGGGPATAAAADEPPPQDGPAALVDTSVLIDGRIVDVAHTGFIPGRLLIPTFVLEELQRLADAGDPVRRAKGRRGLTAVEDLKAGSDVVCEIVVASFPGTPDVDAQLVKLARLRQSAIMTNDYNLNRLARIEGVRVLNLNDLANAMKPIVSTGEALKVSITKEGKEPDQGVGYLEDGTMVVVENGRRHIEETVRVTVTSVLQTPAGRMIFAAMPPAPEEQRARPPARGRAPRVANR